MSSHALTALAITACLTSGLVTRAVASELPPSTASIAWSVQVGTFFEEHGQGVAVDGLGNTYMVGFTTGSVGGANSGGADAFLAKYDAGGANEWTAQLGTSALDEGWGVTVDHLGNSYVTGGTSGSLGGANAGSGDFFLAKYNTGGEHQWTAQLGTSGWDQGRSVDVDAQGNIYITGLTSGSLGGTNQGLNDAFLLKYGTDGVPQWMTQLGSSAHDKGFAMAVDGLGNSYITGGTEGSLGSGNAGASDAFLAKYDSSGSRQWTRLLGSAGWDQARGVAVDGSGNTYITGLTTGSLGADNEGVHDAFLAKYDTNGIHQWTQQVGTGVDDMSFAVVVDDLGRSYIAGRTAGDLDGDNQGLDDAFLTRYDADGEMLWTWQFGTNQLDVVWDLALDEVGTAIYLTGSTEGSLFGPNAGGNDAFVFSVLVPEPGSLALFGVGGLLLLWRRRPSKAERAMPPSPQTAADGIAASKPGSGVRGMSLLVLSCALVAVSSVRAAQAMEIELDYTGDTFFASHSTAQAALEAAAADISGLISTSLTATLSQFEATHNGSSVEFNTTYRYINPADGAVVGYGPTVLNADQFVLVAGGAKLAGNTLAQGGPGAIGYSASYGAFNANDLQVAVDAATAAATDSLTRGAGPVTDALSGAFDQPFDDVTFSISWGASIGSVRFDIDTDNNGVTDDGGALDDFWHFDHTSTVDPNKVDFYTVALHEILHALGVGGSQSWQNLIDGNDWLGDHVITLLGSGEGVIDDDGGHLTSGLMSSSLFGGIEQEALMTSSLAAGERRYITELDAAFLSDIQWTMVPEPGSVVLLCSMGSLFLLGRRRPHGA